MKKRKFLLFLPGDWKSQNTLLQIHNAWNQKLCHILFSAHYQFLSFIYISTFYPYLFSVGYLLSVIIFHTIYYTIINFYSIILPFDKGQKNLPVFKGQRQYHRDNKREILGWPESLFGFFCNILQNLRTFWPTQ